MRIWDLPPERLCRSHLLGEHRELHALWTILTEDKKGYRCHPETRRWVGKLKALHNRHRLLAEEMMLRGYRHKSPLDESLAAGEPVQTEYVDTVEEQVKKLRMKGCGCRV